MRVIFNGYAADGVGGPQRYASAFQAAMRDRGIDAIGLAMRKPSGSESDPVELRHPHGVTRLHFLEIATRAAVFDPEPGTPAAVADAAEAVVGLLEREKPDAVVLNGFSLTNAYLARAAGLLGIPFHVSHHGFWFAEIPATLPEAAQARMRKMEADAIREATANIYLNDWSVARVREAYPDAAREDDIVIPLPYNELFREPAAPTLPPDPRPTLGFVARWDPIKDVALVRAFAESASDLRVVSPIRVGGRPSLASEEDAFRRAVSVVDPLSQAELAGFYRSCDLMLLPSRFDVSPTVVMEAALQGRGTVIAPTTGWIDAYERLGMEDWVMRERTPEGLAAAVRRCLGRPVHAPFAEEIKERHSPGRVFDAWASLISSRA